jgi:hypothetical protein
MKPFKWTRFEGLLDEMVEGEQTSQPFISLLGHGTLIPCPKSVSETTPDKVKNAPQEETTG